MRRRTLVLGGWAMLWSTGECRAREWSLVTEEEFGRESLAPRTEGALPMIDTDAPTITVEQPDETKPAKAPVTIQIGFHPASGASIDVSSFRVVYGLFGIDITDRIRANATVTASGVSAQNARLPSGHHSVTVRIGDNLGRVGTRRISFTVV